VRKILVLTPILLSFILVKKEMRIVVNIKRIRVFKFNGFQRVNTTENFA
jgi:hypothetical protein